MLIRLFVYIAGTSFALGVMGFLLLIFAAIVTIPTLPSLEVLTDYRPKIPLRIYSTEGLLIGEFGEEHRDLVKIEEVPEDLKHAIIAAEDERFYQHGGVDYLGVLRAAYSNVASGLVRQGASTITMQVARNFFLTRKKTLTRKFSEALLAFKIEQTLSKDKILELYMNQIYLGQRSYGFASAARVYFGKKLSSLSVAESAMLAGLPKAPSRYNPVVNPARAKSRQLYVLRRMEKLNFITNLEFEEAKSQELVVVYKKYKSREFPLKADYVAEMVRQKIYERYKEETYTRGLRVYTTVRKLDQEAAYEAVRQGVMNHDKRHGYRGPEGFIRLSQGNADQGKFLDEALKGVLESDGIHAAVVLSVNSEMIRAYRKGGETIKIAGEGLRFVEQFLDQGVEADKKYIRPGSLIRVIKNESEVWHIVQLPQAEAALVSMDPEDGEIRALVGGFDFNRNQFNHITQAFRQPGSSFKPFIYSASLEKGFTPATVINDAPISFTAEETGSREWEPRNYAGKFAGPLRMREALAKSKNLVSIRILQAIGVQYAQDYITRFGFNPKLHPPYLPMALGAGSASPMQMITGYAAFANGGFRVVPHLIKRVEDAKGEILEQTQPVLAGVDAKQIIDPRNAYIMTSMLKDVVKRGTAVKAKKLGRTDLAGKTGTTNNFIDAWFCGFQTNLVAVSWIGYDIPRTLGKKETGSGAALPIWISYMGKALNDMPTLDNTNFDGIVSEEIIPKGIVAARVDAATGFRDEEGEVVEYFFQENLPPKAGSNFGGMESFLQERMSSVDNRGLNSSDSVSNNSSNSDSSSGFKFSDFFEWD
ncbi:MAG: penicillin-binding protein [Nitrosomonadaceae bacterium]|nr:penicillin-binding protein [Nitrosomonadaceae bacterium]|tara:strand:- start:1948 stop:4401 length:2454 start_codon:yes stop_codon:yes gene_type:complete